ncbi:glucosyl-dolichyl phosphate glucuronosyltransferase [Desulfovibrionales bacterium]
MPDSVYYVTSLPAVIVRTSANQVQPTSPKVTVVVCTHNRADYLVEALTSLVTQDALIRDFEIIVVDNNSTDATATIVASFVREYRHFQVILESRQGLSHARNAGAAAASAPWVAYMDDDARALPGYISRLIAVTAETSFDCLGGVYLPLADGPRPHWYRREYESNEGRFLTLCEMPDGHFAEGMNMAFRKSALIAIGGFSPAIGMNGRRVAYGEETLAQLRLLKQGRRIGFDPEFKVEHRMLPHKLKLRWFLRSSWAVGRDTWDTLELHPKPVLVVKALVVGLILPLRRLPGALWRLVWLGYYWQNLVIDTLAPACMHLSKALEGLRLLVGYDRDRE